MLFSFFLNMWLSEFDEVVLLVFSVFEATEWGLFMMKCFVVLVLTTLTIAPLAAAASPATFLTLQSQPGDFIGQGVTQTFSPGDGTFQVNTVFGGGVSVFFHTASFSSFWSLEFGPPAGEALTPAKEYEGAQRFSFHSPTRPGMDVNGDGRGCNTLAGRFLVSEVAIAADGTVQKLAIDFEQHCEGSPPALFGSVRFNSEVPAVPQVSIANATTLKGNAGTSDSSVIISLSLPSTQVVTVHFGTADGTAMNGIDYRTSHGKVSFPVDTTAQTITIPILGNRVPTGNRSFTVALDNPIGAPIADGLSQVTILDPNVPLSVLSMFGQAGDFISPGELILTAADGVFTSTRNFDQGVSARVNNGDNWTLDFAGPTNATLVPGAYESAQRFPFQSAGFPGLDVSGAGRGCNSLTGRFDVLDASYAANGDVLTFAADFEQHCEAVSPALFGSIRINSNLQQLSVSNAVIDGGEQVAVFTVTLNPPAEHLVSVNFSTADGTAIAGGDYNATFQAVTFAPGESKHKISVGLLAQPPGGPAKKFFGQLSSPIGAPIWISQGTANLGANED